jgi:hypothetical protein
MDFEDNLRLVLSPAEQLPPHILLGQYYYQFVNGKRVSEKKKASRFREPTPHELEQLLCRLQDTPQQHVIEMNICYNHIGPRGCSALAQALPHLSALQNLNLEGNLILIYLVFFD